MPHLDVHPDVHVDVQLSMVVVVGLPLKVLTLYFRDAEMTIKISFERSSPKGGSAGGSKRGSTGDPS